MIWILSLLFSAFAHAECTLETEITGTVGPATLDLVERAQARAERDRCHSILLSINTPGGSLQSTRLIVEKILNSPVPYLCLVAPAGGRAGSAGAIILQACHVAGALSGTNLGAATPVALGQEMPKDLRQKILNDTRSWLESLTQRRGRSDQFGRDIILEAKAVTAEEALKLKGIDWVGASRDEFLKFSVGREVRMRDADKAKVQVGSIARFEHDSRYKLLSLIADPELAYMLLLASLALIYFEITHAGAIVPGVVGALGLVLAFVALHKLDVEWGGLALIFLGIGMLIAEIFIPSFGALGIGGIVAFVMGSLLLFDPSENFGYRLPWTVIAPVAIAVAVTFLGVGALALKTFRVKRRGGFDDLMGRTARVVNADEGMLEIDGEIWRFERIEGISVGDLVRIEGNEGLVLKIKKEQA